MDATGPSVYREAAARCRKAARSSTDPKEWIVMAEQWEWLADTAGGSWLRPFKSRHHNEPIARFETIAASAPAGSHESLASRTDSETNSCRSRLS